MIRLKDTAFLFQTELVSNRIYPDIVFVLSGGIFPGSFVKNFFSDFIVVNCGHILNNRAVFKGWGEVRIQKRNERNGIVKWIPLAAGIICGAAIIWMLGESILQDEMFFGVRLFETERYTEYKRISYFIYLLKVRGLQAAFVVFMSFLHKKKTGLFLWAWLTGCGFGMGGFIMVQRWGMIGALGYLFMILPHYICYFYGYGGYYENDYSGQYTDRPGKRNYEKTGKNLLIIGVVIMGIFMECYVNPFFIKLFANLFL